MQIEVKYSKYLSSIRPSIHHHDNHKESISFWFQSYSTGRYSLPIDERTDFEVHATGAFRKIIKRHVENIIHEAAKHKGAGSKKDYEISGWSIGQLSSDTTLTWSIRFWKDKEGSVHRVDGFTKLNSEQISPVLSILNMLMEPATEKGITIMRPKQ